MSRRIKLTLEYDGTDFKGFQVQHSEAGSVGATRTVQGELERALRVVAGQPLRIAGASRTDAGVHALGQVASFLLPDEVTIPANEICQALNGNLPKDMSALVAEEVALDFHPHRDALGKIYAYGLISRRARPALLRRTHWHVRFPLEIEPMRQAARALIGTHDFTSFATKLAETQAQRLEDGKTALATVREIRRLDVQVERIDGETGGAGDGENCGFQISPSPRLLFPRPLVSAS